MSIVELCVFIITLVMVILGFYSVTFLNNLSNVTKLTAKTMEEVNQIILPKVEKCLNSVTELTDSLEDKTIPLVNQNLTHTSDVTAIAREKTEQLGVIVDKLSVIGEALDQVKSVTSFLKNLKK